jgi:bla regulator protein blaR1
LIRLRGWLRIRTALRASVPLDIAASVGVRESPGLLEPGVVGWWRPVLLVPEGIAERLTPRQLEAVLAHELCHVRRRDNLTSAIHMIVEALFWFHPLVWWIGARLVEERERACDEGVLSLGNDPHVYAEAILNVCKLYVESPLACVSGVTGSDLKKRIEAIMTNRLTFRLNFAKKMTLAVAGTAAFAVPIVVGTMNAPRLGAQSPPAAIAPVVAPVVNEAPARLPPAPPVLVAKQRTPQQAVPPKAAVQAPARAVFEVASVKPCAPGDSGRGRSGRGGGGEGGQGPSPARLSMVCQPLQNLIRTAYIMFPDGHRRAPGRMPPLEGPSWTENQRYKVDATAEGVPGQEMMRGPMLQALLEDRFKLKIHQETREVPVYALTVAKNGPKLKAFEEGTCIAFETFVPPPQGSPEQKFPTFCGMISRGKSASGVNWRLHGGTLDDLARALGMDLDRIVINKTGIEGKYEVEMEFAVDETTAGLNSLRVAGGVPAYPVPAEPTGGLSVFTAIQQQLGLKLESAKGPREFFVIDRVEKPTEN